jgi:hypothetical protein
MAPGGAGGTAGGGGDGALSGDEMVLTVAAGRGEPEYMLAISRPGTRGAPRGAVRVREWTSDTWASAGAERVLLTEDVYARVERAHHERRRVSVELPRLRAWLDGRPR